MLNYQIIKQINENQEILFDHNQFSFQTAKSKLDQLLANLTKKDPALTIVNTGYRPDDQVVYTITVKLDNVMKTTPTIFKITRTKNTNKSSESNKSYYLVTHEEPDSEEFDESWNDGNPGSYTVYDAIFSDISLANRYIKTHDDPKSNRFMYQIETIPFISSGKYHHDLSN